MKNRWIENLQELAVVTFLRETNRYEYILLISLFFIAPCYVSVVIFIIFFSFKTGEEMDKPFHEGYTCTDFKNETSEYIRAIDDAADSGHISNDKKQILGNILAMLRCHGCLKPLLENYTPEEFTLINEETIEVMKKLAYSAWEVSTYKRENKREEDSALEEKQKTKDSTVKKMYSVFKGDIATKKTDSKKVMFHAIEGTLGKKSKTLCGIVLKDNSKAWFNSMQKEITCKRCATSLEGKQYSFEENPLDSLGS